MSSEYKIKIRRFFLLIPTVFILLILKIFEKKRIYYWGNLRGDRIGHFSMNTAILLADLEKRKLCSNENITYIFSVNGPVCNKYLLEYWSKRLVIIPAWIGDTITYWGRHIGKFFNFKKDQFLAAETGLADRDILRSLGSIQTLLKFSEHEECLGSQFLESLGLDQNSKFVCLNVRDNAYLQENFSDTDWSYHNYRDRDVNDYIPAIRSLVERGIYVFRVGALVKHPVRFSHPLFFDYAVNGMRTEFLDVYLASKCYFCISQGSGFDGLANIFNRPLAMVDHLPISHLYTWNERCLNTVPRHVDITNGRVLTLSEISQVGANFCTSNECFARLNIHLERSSTYEIVDLVLELDDLLMGKMAHDQKRLDELQEKFWLLYYQGNKIGSDGETWHGDRKCCIGRSCLLDMEKRGLLA